MIIVGIDPGIQNTGVAALKVSGCSYELITSENIQTTADMPFDQRLKKIYDGVYSFLKIHQPKSMALEEIFYSRNVKVALKMGHARGVTLLSAVNLGIPISEYSPREVKLSVTGNGNASKYQVQQMVVRLLNLTETPQFYDITDAMAVAYCHCLRMKKINMSD